VLSIHWCLQKRSGLKHLSDAARAKATDKKASKFEKVKAEKCGSTMWTEIPELAALLREGKTNWEDLNLDDVDIRMKFAGMFHRGKRTPKRFMMRLKVGPTQLALFGSGTTASRAAAAAAAAATVALDTPIQCMHQLQGISCHP